MALFSFTLSIIGRECGYSVQPMQEVVVSVVAMAVSTVMRSWMTVFQVFRSFRIFIIVKSQFK